MKLHHIRDVLAVAETGSLRAASRQLGITQPAITRSIHDLESDLGAPLFERHAHGMRLTSIGQVFARRAATVRSELRRAKEEVDQLKGHFTGEVSVAMSPGAAIALLPTMVSSFQRRYPKAVLKLTESFFQSIESEILSGEIDFFFGAYDHELSTTSLSVEKLADNQRVIIARRHHPLVGATQLSELVGAKWIRPAFANRPDEVDFQVMFDRAGLPPPEVVLHTRSTLMTLLAISNTDLLTVLPVQWLDFAANRDVVEPITLEDATPSCAPMCLVRRIDVPLTPVAEHLSDLARKAAMNYQRAMA